MASRIVSIVGRKNAGKTTLTVALAAELARRHRRVMTIKHGHHPADVDRPGADSWRHFQEAGAERTLLVTPELRVLFDRAPDEYEPVALARRYLADSDIVLAEGFKHAPLPKIEVFRPSVNATPLYDPAAPNAGEWIAIVTDDVKFRARCPVLRFGDTAWMTMLASMAWDRAAPLDP